MSTILMVCTCPNLASAHPHIDVTAWFSIHQVHLVLGFILTAGDPDIASYSSKIMEQHSVSVMALKQSLIEFRGQIGDDISDDDEAANDNTGVKRDENVQVYRRILDCIISTLAA